MLWGASRYRLNPALCRTSPVAAGLVAVNKEALDVRHTAELPRGVTSDCDFTRQGSTVAFIMGTFAVFFTFPLGVLGIVLSNMALNRVKSRPGTARKLALWSWISFIPGAILGAIFTVLFLNWTVTSLVG